MMTSKPRQLNVGLIGYGFMGRTHSYAYRNLPLFYENLPFKVNLLGICSSRLENAEKARDQLGYEYAIDDYTRLIADKRIDIINVCTPNNLHFDILIKAIEAGKHIYCDKPLVISEEQAGLVVKALVGKDIIHQMAFNNRFLPAILRARQLVDDGRIGRVLNFRASYLHSGSVDPGRPMGWKLDRKVGGGGVLFDLGSHVLDLVYYLAGEYGRVMAKNNVIYKHRPDTDGNLQTVEAEDTALIIAEMKGGGTGIIEATKAATGTNDELRLEIHGDRGALRFNLMDPNWLHFYDNTLPEQPLGGDRGFKSIECVQRYEKPGGGFPAAKAGIGWLRGHVHSIYSFLDCVDKGLPASPSLIDGAYIQQIMARCYESAASGIWVDC